jgi:hypothetical protein
MPMLWSMRQRTGEPAEKNATAHFNTDRTIFLSGLLTNHPSSPSHFISEYIFSFHLFQLVANAQGTKHEWNLNLSTES